MSRDEQIIAAATGLLGQGPWSVVRDKPLPPGAGRHDYVSFAAYAWPNPDTPDGLPYVNRDGQRNPDAIDKSDRPAMTAACFAALTLSHAFELTGNAAFSRRAGLVLRQFFLDPPTRMNPHLRFAQGVPGGASGKSFGIIDGNCLMDAADAAGRLREAPGWSEGDAIALRNWFANYLDWLLTSDAGRRQAARANNHGTFYDVQVVTLAGVTGRDEVAQLVLEAVPDRRLRPQIDSTGGQPHELGRTLSWDYSVYNLRALTTLADLGERHGIDLWRVTDEAGEPLIRKACVYMARHARPDATWPHPQIKPPERSRLVPVLELARRAYGGFEAALNSLPSASPTDRGWPMRLGMRRRDRGDEPDPDPPAGG
jgi:hypothetical protein